MPNFLDRLAYNFLTRKARSGGAQRLLLDTEPRWTNWNNKTAVTYGYKASTWVFACASKKAKLAASVPWFAYKRNRKGEWEEQPDHPLEQLINKPNPFMSRSQLIERMVLHLELVGNSLQKKTKFGNTTVELWPIGPDGIKPQPDKNEFIRSYMYEQGNEKIEIPPDEILHQLYVDPSNVYWGIAPLQVAAKTVDTDVEAVTWNKISLQNRAVTDGVFTFEGHLTRDQWEEARAQVAEQHQGAQNARAPWVLGNGSKWNQMSLSPAEMDFIESRKLTREEICGIFQVPPPIVGILDKANYSNMQEARRVFWLDTIVPLLEDIKNSFNQSLAREWGDDIELDFDLSNVEALQENFNEKINAAEKLWKMGVPFNMVNQRLELGFDSVEGGDIGFLPMSIQPATLAATLTEPEPATPQPNDPPDPELIPPGNEDDPPKKAPGPDAKKGFNLSTDKQKAIYWKSFERRRLAWYSKVTKQARKIFKAENAAIRDAFKKSGKDKEALAAIDPRKWEAFFLATYEALTDEFGNIVYSDLKSAAGFATKAEDEPLEDFDPYDEDIQLYLQTVAADKVVMITDHTRELTKEIIRAGREKNLTVDQIAEELHQQFEDYSEHRAFRIARTEVAAGSNYGSFNGALQAERRIGTLEKEWVDSDDSRVRESHKAVGGENRAMDDFFSNGLLYPGDMMHGSAKEVIHCRCVLVYNTISKGGRAA